MKNLRRVLTIVIVLTTTIIAHSQDSVYVAKHVDNMSGESYIYSSRAFIVANSSKTVGFKLDGYIVQDDASFGMVTAEMVGLGSCNENDEIIILFESGDRIIHKSNTDFNCDGKAYFFLSEADYKLLRTQTMSRIRITNGKTYDSYTGDVKAKDKRYFIQLFYALDNQLITKE